MDIEDIIYSRIQVLNWYFDGYFRHGLQGISTLKLTPEWIVKNYNVEMDFFKIPGKNVLSLQSKTKTMSKKTLFLGGTCNNSQWREQLIPLLNDNIDAFNPVVADWTPECQEIEKEKRKTSDVILYLITPLMTGVFSIAEAVQDSNIRPEKTIFAYVPFDGEFGFSTHQIKSLEATLSMIESNGAKVARSIEEVASIINNL